MALIGAALGLWQLAEGADVGAVDSIAVLPLDNVGGDPGLDYLSEGLAESLIGALSQADGLRVASRAATFRYHQRAASSREVGRALEVRGVLTGRLARSSDRLGLGGGPQRAGP